MIIRKLNDQGQREFGEFINSIRQGSKPNTPSYLLTDRQTSEPLDNEIDIEQGNFNSRYELGEYLVKKFAGQNMQILIDEPGMWSWLALFWFDQLCPVKADGNRKASEIYNYVLSHDYKHKPRHAILTTWQLVEQLGEDSRFLLSRELDVRGELIEQLMARQFYLACDGVMKAASTLYYDPERSTFKKGAAARKSAGCVARYVSWLQQIELTYDLFSLSRDDVMGLMPQEFERFKTN